MNSLHERGEMSRWRRDAQQDEAEAAALVEAARPEAPLTPEAMSRMARGIQSRRQQGGARRSRGLSLRWQFAAFLLVSVVSVATAKGMMTLWRRYVAPPRAAVAPAAAAPVAGPRRAVRVAAEMKPPLPRDPPGPVEEMAADGDVTAQAAASAEEINPSQPLRRTHHRRPPSPSPGARSARARAPADAPATSSLTASSEAQLVGRALSRLRQDHDPAGALAVLDTYARSFPRGILANEAEAARLEATLAAGDRKTALALLDARASFPGRLGTQWLLTRAELRASAGRYAEALADFERVRAALAGAPSSESERALYGRAVCLGRMGRTGEARTDLLAYRARFPQGRHAAEVNRLLGEGKSGDTP